jgi:hypothetical protein
MVDDNIVEFTKTLLNFNHKKTSLDNVTNNHNIGSSIGGQSMTSEGSNYMTPSIVFSKLVNIILKNMSFEQRGQI